MSGQAFVDALLSIVGEVDRSWNERVSLPTGDPARE
jgi:hypothetical protein